MHCAARVLQVLGTVPNGRVLWKKSKVGFALAVLSLAAVSRVETHLPDWTRITLVVAVGAAIVVHLAGFLVKIADQFRAGYED